MQKLSRKKFELKCQELGVGANQSMFFKKGFFQKFGCSPFCTVVSEGVSADTAQGLQESFEELCEGCSENLQRSLHVIVHFNINEAFALQRVQNIMESLHRCIREDTNVVMSVQYYKNDEKRSDSLHLFLEEE